MSELRKDPILGRWVIIASERGKRPSDFHPDHQTQSNPGTCPFCEGNEDLTTPEILSYRERGSKANGPGWRLRVVPNKFPALQVEGSLQKRGEGMYDKMAGIGAHEVIIESPKHHVSLVALDEEAIGEVLWVYRDRMVDLKRDHRFMHGMLFKNVGPAAGASLEHTHSQLIVTPTVPITIAEEINGADEFFRYRGRCIFCDMIEQERSTASRLVVETEHFTAFCPFASRFPFETWIVPNHHSSHYENIQKTGVDDLAGVLKRTLAKLERVLDRPPYNYVIHTAPFNSQELPHYHWHIEIIPRLTKLAGFEWGTGFYINPVPPEEAARFLREA